MNKIIRLKIQNDKNTIIDIISKEEYLINIKNVSANIINDRKILEIASFANTYYKNEVEVDFVLCEKKHPTALIQVTDSNLENTDTYEREVNGIKDAMKHLKLKEGLIITRRRTETIKCNEGIIKMIPAYRWLLTI